MKRAIVTGATGAIGTALVEELVRNNIEVLVLVREDSKRIGNILQHPLVQIKNCALDELCGINNTKKPYDVFYHLAWVGTTGSERHDMYLQNKNVKYALDAVGAAKRFDCMTFIGAGSQAEYGCVKGLMKPDTPANPQMGYGYAKLCAGQMTREYARQLGLNHIWTRILSVYGPNDGAQSMVMSTIQKLQNREVPQFTKGEQMWDYLYSGDAARAFYLLGEYGINGKTYVIGSGQARPLAEYIREIRDEVSPNAELEIGAIPYKENQVMNLQADISELQADTGFNPKMKFRDGIREILMVMQKAKCNMIKDI